MKIISRTLPIGILAVMTVSAYAAIDPPLPVAGMIEPRDTACARVQSKGPKCEPPVLSAESEPGKRVAAHLARALFFIDVYDLQSALSEAEAAVRLDGRHAESQHLLARLLLSRHDLEGAERETAAAIALRPNDPDINATNAERMRLTSGSEALRAFSDILAKHPGHRFSREARAELLMEAGNADEALADIAILMRDGASPKLYELRAISNLMNNEPAKSIPDFTEALKASPHSATLLTARAMAYEMTGDDDAALRDYEAILGPVGGPPIIIMQGDKLAKYQIQRAGIFIRQKRFADAAAEAGNALSMGGKRALLRAQVYLRQNGFPELSLDGKDSPALRDALKACFGLNSCIDRVHEVL